MDQHSVFNDLLMWQITCNKRDNEHPAGESLKITHFRLIKTVLIILSGSFWENHWLDVHFPLRDMQDATSVLKKELWQIYAKQDIQW